MGPRWPRMSPRRPKRAPRALARGPSANIATIRETKYLFCIFARWVFEAPKTSQEASKIGLRRPWRPPGVPQDGPRGPQE
eukprot:8037134-Pyramimonas_sp.AAC.1